MVDKSMFLGPDKFKKAPLGIKGYDGVFIREFSIIADRVVGVPAKKYTMLRNKFKENESGDNDTTELLDALLDFKVALIRYSICRDDGTLIFDDEEDVRQINADIFNEIYVKVDAFHFQEQKKKKSFVEKITGK